MSSLGIGRIFAQFVKKGVNVYILLPLGFRCTLNLSCFIGIEPFISAVNVPNKICDTVIAFIQFHSIVLKVDDDISIVLMGKCEGN